MITNLYVIHVTYRSYLFFNVLFNNADIFIFKGKENQSQTNPVLFMVIWCHTYGKGPLR